MWNRLKTWVAGTQSNFKRGDSVQLKEGGALMCVIEVITHPEMPEPVINCQWFDPATGATRTNLFRESRLVLFNWYAETETKAIV